MTANREYPPNPLPCGCRVAGTLLLPSQANDLHVEFCSLHEAAPELLKALELMLQLDDGWHCIQAGDRERTRERAYAAVGKTARPQSSPGESESGGGQRASVRQISPQ